MSDFSKIMDFHSTNPTFCLRDLKQENTVFWNHIRQAFPQVFADKYGHSASI